MGNGGKTLVAMKAATIGRAMTRTEKTMVLRSTLVQVGMEFTAMVLR